MSDIIDTSKMNEGQRAALEMTEAARDEGRRSFAGDLFMGRVNWPAIFPFPEIPETGTEGEAFLQALEKVLREQVDADEIDRTGEIPDAVMAALAKLGSFGIKVPKAYGGLGLSQSTYCRAAMLLGSWCGNCTALLSAHQSIGVPQPLLVFGTEEQKKKFLPRVAGGEISAFALTEKNVGSDPAKMETRAEPTADGKGFVLNGEKLWCTNGTRAGVIIVMAKTPPKIVNGKPRDQVTAFILEMNTPGVKVEHRCRFMGLRALYNAVISFKDVYIPRESIVLAEGKGLRVALTTLNTGRLTLPAACVGLGKRCLEAAKAWANERVQWGSPIGQHAAIADKIAHFAANIFAMEAMTMFTAALVDRHDGTDIRLEAAMCKMWGTEAAWRIVDETLAMRGGRGYETVQSQRARGEKGVPVERYLRDSRINLIFEGSSEIMRLFIAREALDAHLKIGGVVLNSRLPMSKRGAAAVKAAAFYSGWYPKQLLEIGSTPAMDETLAPHAQYVSTTSHKLARQLFHAMVRFGPKLEKQQMLLARFVEIGTELFAMTATLSRAQQMTGDARAEAITLADYFCKEARIKIEERFRGIHDNNDRSGYKIARGILDGKFAWMDEGLV